jgi:hypothetical protein
LVERQVAECPFQLHLCQSVTRSGDQKCKIRYPLSQSIGRFLTESAAKIKQYGDN